MGAELQLTLFEDLPPTIECLDEDVRQLKEQLGSMRRGLFQRYDNLNNEISQLRADMGIVLEAVEALERLDV